ncbi:DUF5908 family protein [Acaryochloris sp. IP29b_bin.148]|uniref:DUF5908 family protein n=1 Tax=Acaryochloris sp. IP29b_bin.148 TaxID=2969218 RepID=UPI003455B807
MPVEIRELIIRTTVVNPGSGKSSSKSATSNGDEALIAACVEQVLKILDCKRER